MNMLSSLYLWNHSIEYQHIIRKLREAFESKQVREDMQMEDDYINELRINAEIIAEKDKSLAEKDKSLAEKDKIIEDDKKSLAEKNESLAEKDKENERLKNELEKLKRQLPKM